MAGIEICGLSKFFRDGSRALEGVDLDVGDGELLALVGPSGSGKTTLLRLIAGLDQPTAGTIRLGGNNLAGVPPHRRNVALVFQNLALYGHLSVADNLAFGQENKAESGKRKAERGDDRVKQVAELLGIEHLLERYPAELSGGEQQRVALGRAIVRQPAALLLDEPLSSLDGPARRGLRRELKRLQRQLGIPTIYVTHDQAEALALGDRIVVLDRGQLQQVASPHEVYHRPASRFVAEFFGPQGMNLIEGELKRENGSAMFQARSFRLPVGDSAAGVPDGQVLCGFRPEDTECGEIWKSDDVWSVESCELLGDLAYVQVEDPQPSTDAPTRLTYCQRTALDYAPSPGSMISLRFRLDRLHWFDLTTGQRLGTLKTD
jgi:multiple sugar transport system ATP-binding protein